MTLDTGRLDLLRAGIGAVRRCGVAEVVAVVVHQQNGKPSPATSLCCSTTRRRLSGTQPVNSLSPMNSDCRLDRFPYSGGIGPLSRLLPSLKYSSAERLPRAGGSGPLSRLFSRSMA